MNRTFSTGTDVDAALNFLGRQERPQVSGEEYFKSLLDDVVNSSLKKADELRFSLVKELLNEENKADSIAKLKDLLS